MNANGVSADEVIAKLLEMGFENSTVKKAVKEVGPSFDDALDYILNGCCSTNRRATRASSTSSSSMRNVRACGKRPLSASFPSAQIRQSSILEHFQSNSRPKRSKTDGVPDVSVSGSEIVRGPIEQCLKPLSGVKCSVEVLSDTSPLDCLENQSDWQKKANSLLQKHFGYSSLKNFQKEVLAAWMAHQDSLVLAATGSGKSLCFQIPALLTGKVVVVISPLISLMHDQCLKLAKHGVSACFLGSGQPDSTVENKSMSGMYDIIYVCPETILRLIKPLQKLAENRGIALFAIDEVHCVSKWGHDFRPDYRRLSELRKNFSACNLKFLKFDIPLMALTATATIQVREDILRSLSMSKETKVVLTSFFRPNLRFTVRHSRTSASSYENDFHELIDMYTGKRRMGEKKRMVMSQELNNVMDSANGSISDEDNISQDDLDNFEDGYSDKDEVDSSQENGSSASKGRELSVEYLENDIDIFQSVNDWDVSCGEFCGQSLCEDWNTRKETRSDIIDLPNKPEERLKLLQEPLEKGSTIIYVPTRKGTLSIANYLCRCGVKAAAYNAALPKSHLRQVHKMFHENTLEVVVATIAFGMGIDKLNVRRIIHYGWPQSLEAYYQEAGRAGRDGKLANCILFANLTRVPSLLPSRRSEEQTKQAYKMLSDCFRYGMNSSCCRAKKLVEYFGEDFSSEKCLLCDVCVDGPPELKNLRKEADLIMQVISAHHASQYRNGSYDDTTSSDIRLRRESYMGKLNLRMIISKIREQSQEFMATELLWWQGLVRIMESRGYIKEGDNKTHVQLKFPELTELGLEFLETKGEQTFHVHPEADMLLSANRPKSFSTFSEWGRGWADPEIRRQRLENMQCNRKPFNAGGKRGRRKSRKQRHSPNLRTARGRIEAKLSKKGARPRSLKH